MSHLQYYDYEKVGTALAEDYKCSQAVRIGDRIECAGQGWFWALFSIAILDPLRKMKADSKADGIQRRGRSGRLSKKTLRKRSRMYNWL